MVSEKKSVKMKLSFCGGADTVTGANFLLEGPIGSLEGEYKRILIDCGLVQGSKLADDVNWEPFPYDPKLIDYLFITHAHIDHIGKIPKIINEGFQGKIYSTTATKDLAPAMLEDTSHILGRNTEDGLDKIYSAENTKRAFSLWEGVDYHQVINIPGGFQVSFKDAGHILGSGIVEITFNGKKIAFTGDLGNSPSPFLRDTEFVTDADYLVMESVYGDRLHEGRDMRKQMLQEVIQDNVKRKGTLMIPCFSLERSQELLFEIDTLAENGRIPLVPFFLDSPLAIKLTEVYKKHEDLFNENAKKIIKSGDDIFMFPGLYITLDTEASKAIFKHPDPKIIIAGSGMSSGGRIVHHETNYLPNPNNTLLLTGYQAAGSLGRLIQEGAKSVRIAGEIVQVQAKVFTIYGYSGHKDSDGLLDFVDHAKEKVKKVFVVMGEPKSALFLVQKIRDYLGISAFAPAKGDIVELEF